MILTTSNVLTLAPTITSGSSSDLPAGLIDQDFSQNYTSSASTLTSEFGSTISIDYVAIAGLNISSGATVTLKNSSTTVSTATLSRNNVVVFRFDAQTFTNLVVTVSSSPINPTISYVAAGSSLTVPNNGYTAGASRAWLNRNTKTKTTTGNNAAPTAVLKKPMAEKGGLNIPNVGYLWSHDEWQTFLDFAEDNLFFVNENSAIPESSYCCFNLTKAKATVHSSTRLLNNVNIKFSIFNGL